MTQSQKDSNFTTETKQANTEKSLRSLKLDNKLQFFGGQQYQELVQKVQSVKVTQKKNFIPFFLERDHIGRLIKKDTDRFSEECGDKSPIDIMKKQFKQKGQIFHSQTQGSLEKLKKNYNIQLNKKDSKGNLLDNQIDKLQFFGSYNNLKNSKVASDQVNQGSQIKFLNFKVNSLTDRITDSIMQTQSNCNQSSLFMRSDTPLKLQQSGTVSFLAQGREKKPIIHRVSPSLGYYDISYNYIEPKVQNVTVKGRERQTSHHQEIQDTFLQGSFNFKLGKNAQNIDFNKQLSRSQTTRKWAPRLYEEDINIQRKKDQDMNNKNNKDLEQEYQFFLKMQRNYPQRIPQPRINFPKTLDKEMQPMTKQAVKEKNKLLLKKLGFDVNDKKFAFLRDKFTMNL